MIAQEPIAPGNLYTATASFRRPLEHMYVVLSVDTTEVTCMILVTDLSHVKPGEVWTTDLERLEDAIEAGRVELVSKL